MGFLTHWPIILIFVIVLIILGPGKLPQIGGAIGGAIKEFRKSTKEDVAAGEPVAPVAASATTAEPSGGLNRVEAQPRTDAPEAPKA